MTRWACFTLGLGVLGCGPVITIDDTDGGSSTGSSGITTSGSATTGSATSATTAPGTTSLPPTTDPTIGPGDSSSGDDTDTTTLPPTATDPTIGPGDSSSGFVSTTGSNTSGSSVTGSYTTGSSTTGEPGDLPDGSDCTLDAECLSGHCYETDIGGYCGDCSSDADCDFGCTQPNPLGPTGSMCNDGELGDGCETEDACAGLECVDVVTLPGIFDIATCSECDVDADCMPGQVCNIDIDAPGLTGVWTCVPTGSVGLGEICDDEGSGDLACSSGFCAVAFFEGLLSYGVCSQCEEDADCPGLETCSEPLIGVDGVDPGLCG